MYSKFQRHNFHIGRYCSLANDIKVLLNLDHDYLKVNSGYLNTDIIKYLNEYEFKIKRKGQVIIQNDVWIGTQVTILPSVTIHNGSVVGARSVVTRDVPPYSIVAGNPARVIKYRFREDIIEKLLSIRWWDWERDKIHECMSDFELSVDEFVDKHYDKSSKRDLKEKEAQSYLYIDDLDYKFPTFHNVIGQFIKGEYEDKKLIVFSKGDTLKEGEGLSKYNIELVRGDHEVLEDLFSRCEYYITNRSSDTVRYTTMADYYNTKILSGVDTMIFD